MPTYVYACRECEERLEVVQKMSDEPLRECPKCPGALRRVLFAPAIVYKGSGFYTTDYKKNGSGSGGSSKPESKDSAAETNRDAKPEAKTETKSEAKSETKTEPASN